MRAGSVANGFRHTTLMCLALTLCFGTAHALDDPMRPSLIRSAPSEGATTAPQQRYQLTSTLVSAQRRIAVINGRRLMVGDRIGSARLVAIEADRAILSEAGRTFTLHLIPVTIKRPAPQPE